MFYPIAAFILLGRVNVRFKLHAYLRFDDKNLYLSVLA